MLPLDCAPSSIPEDAEEVLEETDEDEHIPPELRRSWLRYSCRVNGEVVGTRLRTADGRLIHERCLHHEAPNGWEREWDDEGRLTFEGFRIDGAEHGVCRQWHEGRLLGWYVMDHGTGLDLWRDWDGPLAEERNVKGQRLHGFLRWWSHGSNARIWWEEHFQGGQPHGMERKWNSAGRIKRGYPRYFVKGERVTKRQYLRAAANDLTLPPYRPEDDRPERALPPEYFETMPPASPPVMPTNPEEWKP